ncbi:MAG: FAD-binding protein [Gammaproteobacteria bacterium]|nr:FAD-binding protein [Gammaproteobacteria bacterium]
MTTHSAQTTTIIPKLRDLLPAHAVLATNEELRPYECDGLSAYRQVPLVVVLPENVEQVQAVVRLCYRHGVPIVARGAGTGLSGGALPLANGVLLSLAKLNRIIEIDLHNRSARVEPGVRNLAISQAAAPHGLYYAPDPSSQIACSIGGNVAENSGGVHCLKYGLTVHNILKLKVVLADGEIVTLGSDACDSAGYDLLALFTGSEGLLGIVVEVTVRLLPKPERTQVLLAAYASVAAAGQTVSTIIGAGIIPAGLEMMDQLAIRAAEDFVHVGYPTDAAAILLCEVDGTNEEVSEHVATIRNIMLAQGATTVRTAIDDQESALLWKGRKAAFPAVGRLAPDYYCMDGTIPRRCLPQVLDEIEHLSKEYDLRVANVFHAGDGNLHPLILYDANRSGELHRAEQFGARILELCVRVGGTITGEHGVGIEKLDAMCVMFQPTELTQFFSVKNAFDPHGLLNPGKAIPSLHRCAELGAMHVHRGQVPFPDIERF